MRFIAFGKYYLSDWFNIIDMIVVYLSVIIDIINRSQNDINDTRYDAITAFRLLRFIRALGTFDRFKLIISTSVTILRSLGILFSLEFCLFYLFAVIGSFAFHDKVTRDAVYDKLLDNNLSAEDQSFWYFIRDNYYYENNMNWFYNTLVVLGEITVVNQWHIITRFIQYIFIHQY